MATNNGDFARCEAHVRVLASSRADAKSEKQVMADPVASSQLDHLRQLYQQEQARVRELEASRRQLELYAEDLQRTFAELRTQLGKMNELHQLSTTIGALLDPQEIIARTLQGLHRLVVHEFACIYLLDGGIASRVAIRGPIDLAPPPTVTIGVGPLGQVLADTEPVIQDRERRALIVALRASGMTVGAFYLVRREGDTIEGPERKLVEMVAAEAAAAIQNARLYEQIRRLATTDPLTGLYNLRYFQDALPIEIARAQRLGYAIGLLMIDIDDFKRVNDTQGHPAGDEVLRKLADILLQTLRHTDIVARYGGEEFAIILPGVGANGLRAVGEKLRRAVASLRPVGCSVVSGRQVTISIGGAACAAGDVDTASLVSEADAALYQAKRAGKNRVCVRRLPASGGMPRRKSHAKAHRSPG